MRYYHYVVVLSRVPWPTLSSQSDNSLCWFFIAFSFCISSFSLFLYLYLYCIGIVTHKKRYDAPHVAWVLYSFITSLHAMITMMIFRLVWFDYCYHHAEMQKVIKIAELHFWPKKVAQKMAEKSPKIAQKLPKIAHNGPKMTQNCQNGPKITQNGPKISTS